jgi:glycosyltransferase involved in cell wall biosynthesis
VKLVFLLNLETVDYKYPWILSFKDRIDRLSRKNKRIAYFYHEADNSTFRYRVYNMIQVMEQFSDDLSASYFLDKDLEKSDQIISSCDVLVICRTKYSDRINRLICLAKAKGVKVFFDIDDFVFNTDYVHLILDTLDEDLKHPQVWDFWFAYIGRLGATLKLCDAVITTNSFLAEHIANYSRKPTHIIPNFLNKEQMVISDRIFNQKLSLNFARDNRIHVGYFSGSPTHNKDFALISDSLVHLFNTDDRVILRIAGYLDLPANLKPYKNRVEFIPFQDFVNLQTAIGLTEINVIPLQSNIFTNCKSELKFFESAIVGTTSIASPTHVYSNLITDGLNGYLSSSIEWTDKLVHAIDKLDDYQNVALNACNLVREKYSWENQIDNIRQVLMSN